MQQSSSIRFKIERKKKHVDEFVERIRSYEGPYQATKRIPGTNYDRWMAHPRAFWDEMSESTSHGFLLETEIVQMYVRARGKDA